MTQGAGTVADLLERHGLIPRRALGQHFLADPNLVRNLVGLTGAAPGDRVVEVGPGTGALTVALAEAGFRVRAYEIDERLRPLLAEVLEGLDVEVRFADALAVLPGDLEGEGWTLVGNLPYNIGTPLLMRLLREGMQIERFVVMVQKEVADRLTAPPGTRTYGLPSVVTALHSEAKRRFAVPPQVFVPPSRVSSAVVTLQRRPAPPEADRALELAAAAFNQRRKMLRRSLARVLSDPAGILAAAGIADHERAEQLTPAQYLDIAREEARRAG